MGKFLKEKKVVIVLNGRYAGKKAVIVDIFERFMTSFILIKIGFPKENITRRRDL